MAEKAKIAVLVSGGGTNLQALMDAERSGIIDSGEIVLVISNNEGAYALERARNAGIEAHAVTKKAHGGQAGFEAAVRDLIDSKGIDLIVLAGFLSILSEDFVKHYDHRIINIHPALIPSFCGPGYYGLADGGEIIAQKAVYIQDGDTPETLQRRVMEEAEWIILPQAVADICRKIVEA